MARPKKSEQANSDVDRREVVLETAAKCICKYGLQKTNAQRIASEMGVSQTTIFYYFPKQRALFDNLIDHIVKTGRGLAAGLAGTIAPRTQRAKLLHHFNGQLRWGEKYPHHIGVLIFTILDAAHSEEMRQKATTALNFGEETVFSLIAGGIVEKEFASVQQPRVIAQSLHKTLFGCLVDQYLRQGERFASDYEPMIAAQIDKLLGQGDST